MNLDAFAKEIEQSPIDDDWLERGAPIEIHDRACLAEDGELIFDGVHAVQRRPAAGTW